MNARIMWVMAVVVFSTTSFAVDRPVEGPTHVLMCARESEKFSKGPIMNLNWVLPAEHEDTPRYDKFPQEIPHFTGYLTRESDKSLVLKLSGKHDGATVDLVLAVSSVKNKLHKSSKTQRAALKVALGGEVQSEITVPKFVCATLHDGPIEKRRLDGTIRTVRCEVCTNDPEEFGRFAKGESTIQNQKESDLQETGANQESTLGTVAK